MSREFWLRVCMTAAIAPLLLVTTGHTYGAPAKAVDARAVGAKAVDTMEQDIDTAVQGVDAFWTRHWPEYFTGTYASPDVLGLYDGTSADVPTCGGEQLEAGNAAYCRPEDYLAWDVGLMREGYSTGDAYVYFIVAHEWGHAIQNRLNSQLQEVAGELQADCIAGAELQGAQNDETIVFEEGDAKELIEAIHSVSDELPWTAEGDHGNADQRSNAFIRGLEGGVDACLPLTAQ
ncbi:neutral zinc metallopeptidase [Streptomyces sp. NPDC093982]|uniref:neutral zinc metallopeptidase n=1 Tax=Streptomyces sp. NPDC093982 TaxID=3155077 RepID=UPI00341FB2CC